MKTPEETYTRALQALESLRKDASITIDFDDWFMLGEFGQEDRTSEYNHRVLYLLLKQLRSLIDPLLVDITHIDHNDAHDQYFTFTSGYFSSLLKRIEKQVYTTYTPAQDSHLMDILDVVDVPLTRYLQKREQDKKSMEDLLESTTLALSDIEAQYLFEKPDNIAVPTSEASAILDPLNDFVKAYKKKIESDDFQARIDLGGLQSKFSSEEKQNIFDEMKDPNRVSKDYYIIKVQGDYYYDGKLVEVPKNNEYYTIFDVFFDNLPHGGLILYKDLYKVLRSYFPKTKDSAIHTKILRTFGDTQNGLIKNTNIVHSGKKLFVVERRKGIRFNNQR